MMPLTILSKTPPRLIEPIEPTSAKLDATSSIVVLTETVAGSTQVTSFNFGGPFFLRGEDYPILVQVWDNDDDAIFD